MSINFVYGDSDFILELQNVNKEPIDKMVECNDRIKCLESLSLILLTYEYNLEELISIFD